MECKFLELEGISSREIAKERERGQVKAMRKNFTVSEYREDGRDRELPTVGMLRKERLEVWGCERGEARRGYRLIFSGGVWTSSRREERTAGFSISAVFGPEVCSRVPVTCRVWSAASTEGRPHAEGWKAGWVGYFGLPCPPWLRGEMTMLMEGQVVGREIRKDQKRKHAMSDKMRGSKMTMLTTAFEE